MYREKNIKRILFGAGVYAKKYKALLEFLQMDFDFFTDNDSTKWGTVLYGKKIIPPDELSTFLECHIIISSTHEVAIRRQLEKMRLSDRIIGLDELYRMCEKKMASEKQKSKDTMGERSIFVDMYEGIGWGGSELWAANLAYGLHNVGERVILLGGTEQAGLDSVYEKLVCRISEKETIRHMVDLMEENLPCVFVNNFAGCGFMAAVILKKKYPDLVKIISVIHNDNKSLFDAHMMLSDYIDKIFCVSNQICQHMQGIYLYDKSRYYFKEQPIEPAYGWKREWNISAPIRIGYAARLVKQQKRADLLTDLIAHLEKEVGNYIFRIAGDGECLENIEKYVRTNGLEEKVQLLGRLPKCKMPDFWKDQDVFVNISEYEGTSLSMLEAMAYGCVPVVTDVSGAREFITDGENGYICKVGQIDHIAECISELSKDREKIRSYGEKNYRIIQDRCNPQKYIEYWKTNLLI